MSSITVTFGSGTSTPEEAFYGNIAWMNNNFGFVLAEVMSIFQSIDSSITKDYKGINNLEELMNEIIQSYNMSILMSERNSSFILDNTSRFNDLAQKVKTQLNELQILDKKTKKSIKSIKRKINRILEKLKESGLNSKEPFLTLIQEYQSILNKESMLEKEENLMKNLQNFQGEFDNYNKVVQEEKEASINQIKQDISDNLKIIDESQYPIPEKIKNLIKKYHSLKIESKLESLLKETSEICDEIERKNLETASLVKEIEMMLKGFDEDPNNEISIKLNKLISQQFIKYEDLETIKPGYYSFLLQKQEEENRKKTQVEILKKITYQLDQMGYSIHSHHDNSEVVEKIIEGESVYLDTDSPEYKILISTNPFSEIITKFVHIVDSPDKTANITQYDKQKDIEHAKKWCKQYDQLKEELKKSGILLEDKIRKDPEEIGIEYVVSKEIANTTRKSNSEMRGQSTR